jgi:hypothetical protein
MVGARAVLDAAVRNADPRAFSTIDAAFKASTGGCGQRIHQGMIPQ